MKATFPVLGLVVALAASGCARQAPPPALAGLDGKHQSLGELLGRAPWTVLVFVSSTCPCMLAHQERLEAIVADYGPRGVQVFAVDSNVGVTPAGLAAEAREYSVPLLADEGARLANQLGAEYATFTVILDRAGRVLYQGGIDSDKTTMHADAVRYVREALDDVTAGHPPRRPEGKALGCVLRKW